MLRLENVDKLYICQTKPTIRSSPFCLMFRCSFNDEHKDKSVHD
jgi:hypothetical protein